VANDQAHQAQGGMPDPIHQFEIKRHLDLEVFGVDASFTNSSLWMIIAAVLVSLLMIWGMGGRALVPTRLQSIAEISYEFIAIMVRDIVGASGMKFFPFVFTIFMFILFMNMLGMLPGAFTATSSIAVTASLALMVFVTVIVVGFAKNGLGFLKLFVPSGIPKILYLLVVPIEVISFLSRPVSHSVRLFANMLAGHITLKVFGGFVTMLIGTGGTLAAVSIFPLMMAFALTALEVLVAFLQAYVFAMLTCMYLHDALHPGH